MQIGNVGNNPERPYTKESLGIQEGSTESSIFNQIDMEDGTQHNALTEEQYQKYTSVKKFIDSLKVSMEKISNILKHEQTHSSDSTNKDSTKPIETYGKELKQFNKLPDEEKEKYIKMMEDQRNTLESMSRIDPSVSDLIKQLKPEQLKLLSPELKAILQKEAERLGIKIEEE